MKIQGLAVIAIIILLPMTMILNNYSTNQIKTLQLQISYDSKLQSATYDAIKAFQLNMSNSTTSDLANSKMRDIKASIKTFYNSLSNHFQMAGYGEEVLRDYVPAIVYTLYDGYYIYSAYDNTLDEADVFYNDAKYRNGDTIYGLKPYIYYSCRYKPSDTSDFVITYSLDSYITIQGKIDNQPVNMSGYLLTGVSGDNTNGYSYKGIKIVQENGNNLKQNVYLPKNDDEVGEMRTYPCMKINGTKYYKDDSGKVFAMINDEQIYQNDNNPDAITNNTNGIKFYKDAVEFKKLITDTNVLMNLKTSDAVDSKGKKYVENTDMIDRFIFKELINGSMSGHYIEDDNSDFNAHKMEVIRNSIETNLMAAIANYNKESSVGVNFAMPKLQEYEWENITHSISMITFLQGLSIGGKIYNGYSIVPNNINDDFVSEDSIYITNSGQYHAVTSAELITANLNNSVGIVNTDFERKTIIDEYKYISEKAKKNIYYYPRSEFASYTSIIDSNNATTLNNQSIYEYLKGAGTLGITNPKYKVAQIYYTALGRERYGMYRVMNKLEDVQEDLVRAGY